MAKIFAFREDRLGFYYEIESKAVLGRAPECDLLIFDRSASRRHCEIFSLDGKFYIADMNSTNGTLVNDQPIKMQTRLEPYDSIKIGQEIFIFEPGLQVISGPAPSALIIESLTEDAANLIAAPAEQAATRVSRSDAPELMLLAHQLGRIGDHAALEEALFRYIKMRFKPTFVSILWPSFSPARRLSSLLSSHADKRLIMSHSPFSRAIKGGEALLWPNSILELSFKGGRRNIRQSNFPCLAGPLVSAGSSEAGLICIENHTKAFSDQDLWAFAAMLGIISPAVARLAAANLMPKCEEPAPSPFSDFLLSSSAHQVKALLSTASQAAEQGKSILLTGEAGSGKLALAEYIHNISPRKKGRMVIADLASIPQDDIEATLFGQLAIGSFPGRSGLVELADGGTLLLRHVEKLPLTPQKLLLMTIEEGIYFNLGATRPKAADLRIISAATEDLWALVEAGLFREDLYSRLSAMTISLPPVREIKQDFSSVLNTFMSRAARDLGLSFNGLDPAALECLRGYSWPGNFAELRLEAGLRVMFSRNGRVAFEDLPAHLRLSQDAYVDDDDAQISPLVLEAEKYQLISAMSRCSGDVEKVAEFLRRRPEHIIIKMRALGLDPMDYQSLQPLASQQGPGAANLP